MDLHAIQGRIKDFWKGGFVCIKVWGVRFASLILTKFTETKLFHFYRIFNNGGGGEEPPRDPPL